jgi:hypothetical protein
MRYMANELAHHRAPANIMTHLRQNDILLVEALGAAGRNDPCPFGVVSNL